jgi:hypothetical protein
MSGPGNGNEQQIWLSKEGKTEGPFSPSQVETMKSSGEYKKYTWIWSAKSKNWEPIYPAPPPPAPTPAKKAETAKTVGHELAAVCHDNRTKAQIVDFKKSGSSWEYRLQWIDTPTLL